MQYLKRKYILVIKRPIGDKKRERHATQLTARAGAQEPEVTAHGGCDADPARVGRDGHCETKAESGSGIVGN